MVGVIFAGVGIVILLLVFSFGGNAGELLHKIGQSYQDGIERADLEIKAEEFVFSLIGFSSILWLLVVFLLHPTPMVGLLLLPFCVCGALVGGSMFLKTLGAKRIASFVNQREMVL